MLAVHTPLADKPAAAPKSALVGGTVPPPDNAAIAAQLDRVAELLEAQHANAYRVRAYRLAAETLRGLQKPVYTILAEEGLAGLERLPTIGVSLARSIEQAVHDGRVNLLHQLDGATHPERIIATVPGIGPVLAGRIHHELGIETLADLLDATFDGRLATVPGFGAGRLRAVQETLIGRLRRAPRAPNAPKQAAEAQPNVRELLAVDREYREKVAAGSLPFIAPQRFNPTGQAWLPILHAVRGSTHYTALYSNTARAHELGMTRDWVVIYRDDDGGSGQWTVITSHFGPLRGKRIVRGREAECQTAYAAQAEPQPT
jgi:DNA polymerase (family X)